MNVMNTALDAPNRRILLVDDSPAIHGDFRKILVAEAKSELESARAAFLGGGRKEVRNALAFEFDSAFQGREALELVERALACGRPYALAFVDVRMPPGWDGIETIDRLWQADASLQVVICTAYSDYTWEDTFERLGRSDRLLILKKPFDPIEISQLATALTEKWNVERRVSGLIEDLRRKEQEARAYASSLETVNRALETSKAAAEKSSEMKTEFLVQLSQEIHAKVSGVLGTVEQLRSPELAGERPLEQLDSVFESSRYLLATLEEVSDLALIESGRLLPEAVEFAPAEPAESVVADLREKAGAKGLELSIERRGPIPTAVCGDQRRIRQILASLVSNAIRYTERGSVRVLVGANRSDAWLGATLTYGVEDTGLGIPRSMLGRLFDPFPGRAREEAGGAGLGLAHAQRLARLLGGDIRVESDPGKGSRFELQLDVEVPAPDR